MANATLRYQQALFRWVSNPALKWLGLQE